MAVDLYNNTIYIQMNVFNKNNPLVSIAYTSKYFIIDGLRVGI